MKLKDLKSRAGRFFVSTAICAIFAVTSLLPAYGGHGRSGFSVDLTNCVESIGVALLPTDQVEDLIPSGFHVVGEGQPVTPIVVRSAN